MGIDLNPLGPGRAAQRRLHLGFDAILADLKARNLQQRVGVFELAQVIITDGADIAHNMGKILMQRVVARQADFGCYAGQRGRIDCDLAEFVPA